MQLDDKTLSRILLEGHYVTEGDLAEAQNQANTHRASITDYLFSEELLTKDLLGQAIAESLGTPYFDLNSAEASREQVRAIPEQVARELRVVMVAQRGRDVLVATDDPLRAGLAKQLAQIFPGHRVSLAFSLPEDIDASFVHYSKSLDSRFSKILEKEERIAPEVLEQIFVDAAIFHASDIHFEPQGNEVLLRFRIDGVLRDAGRLPRVHYENVLNRIKVQSGMRIDEHMTAQDGSLHFQKDSISIDLRASIIPTVEGEKVVLRVLTSYVQGLVLSELGLSPRHQEILQEAASKPFGMIVVTGPTGSGKTTTLYSLLKLLNRSDVNITTIEDPVEYKMRGINQIQVNAATDLTFARGLRSIVRQDPNIIFVGEIRDSETAEIAVNAALTGHLLLSTFHANDAATAVPRLLDMGIEPFLLASTLELIIAQRLVRKICDQCRRSGTFTSEQLAQINKKIAAFFPEKVTLYEGAGCEACGHSGYKGRTAIYEFIAVTPDIQEKILHHPSAQEIAEVAFVGENTPLFVDGIEKVKSGITTLDELLRVAEPPS